MWGRRQHGLAGHACILLSGILGHGAVPEAPALVEVYYSTSCPSCQEFIQSALAALLRAGLPGQQVSVSVLPLFTHKNVAAHAHLCAMRWPLEQHVAVDAAPLRRALDFMACDLEDAEGSREERARRCAQGAGWDWEDLQSCAEGNEGRELSARAAGLTEDVQESLARKGFTEPPGIPWVFVGGTLIRCQGSLCFHEIRPEGKRALANGTAAIDFLEYVCRGLSPQPPACRNFTGAHSSFAGSRVREQGYHRQPCEECFLDWGHPLPVSVRFAKNSALAGLVLVAALAAAGLALAAWRRRTRECGEFDYACTPLKVLDEGGVATDLELDRAA